MLKVSCMNNEDMSRWDAFVAGHPFGFVYHLSRWCRVLESSFSHIKGRFLGLVNEHSGEVMAGLPVYEVRSWLTGNRLVSIPFSSFCDPLISSPDHMPALMSRLLELFRAAKASSISLRTLHSPSFISDREFAVSRFFQHHYLPLDREPEKLLKLFNVSNVRRRIARAEKSHLELRRGASESDVRAFYQLFVKSRRRQRLPPIPYRFFRSLWTQFGSSGELELTFALHGPDTVAGMIMLKYKHVATVEFIADDKTHRDLSPNHFLYWEAIKKAWLEGYRVFSFGRTSPHNKTLLTFKSRWGTKVSDLPEYFYPHDVGERMTQDDSSWKYRAVGAMTDVLPESLFRLLGEACYRHMG
jgi:CelD/BcsL family acetyltransferase involved in cellulose biosynthesis